MEKVKKYNGVIPTIITIIILMSVFCLFMMPNMVEADSKYKTMNLENSLKDEGIEYDLKDYKETDDQVTIYLFRGKGCTVCKKFLTFLNSIVPEYGKYFKLVSYETWNNPDNKELLNKVADFTGVANEGVPYIVIGDQVFGGYYSGYDEDIKKAIKDEYNKKTKYDVLEEMNKDTKNNTSNSSIWWSLLFTFLSTIIIIGYIYLSNKKIMVELAKLETKKK